jgi:hypothetical protein
LVLGGDGPTTLLTSPNAFSHLREIELDDRGDTVVVKPAELLEVTARYELFTIKTD